MPVDIHLVNTRIQEILSFKKELDELSKISESGFINNRERQYAVMHLLQLAIEASLSLGNHIVARENLGIPKNYQDTFSLLSRGGILPEDFAGEMKKMARFRNKLVHIYWEIDLKQIYEILTTKLADFPAFAEYIRKKYPVSP